MTHANHRIFRFNRRAFVAASTGIAIGAWRLRTVAGQTPVAGEFAPFAERIGALLAMTPAVELSPDVLLPFYYADVAKQMDAAGVEMPDPSSDLDRLTEGYARASYVLPLAAHAYQVGLSDGWFETFGFQPYGVHQALTLNDTPNVVSIFAGGIDGDSVRIALESHGFQRLEQEAGGSYWTVGDELDLESPVGRLGLGMMNSAAIYGDTVVFAQRESALQDVTQTIAGLTPSMLEQGVWSSMIGLFSPDIVGLIPVSASALGSGIPEASAGATPVAAPEPGESAGIEYLAFGARVGAISEPLSLVGEGTPEATPVSDIDSVPAHVEVRIRYGNAAPAQREADAIAGRWAQLSSPLTGQPFAELMTLEDSRVHADDPAVVALEFTSEVPNRWIQLAQTRDFAPFLPVVG